jgi:hypothetical protein
MSISGVHGEFTLAAFWVVKTPFELHKTMVRDTGIEPVTSSVSGKRSPAELIAPGK